MPPDQPSLTIGELADILRRRWRTAASAGALALLVAIGVIIRMTPLYESTAVLMLNRGRKAIEFTEENNRGESQFSQLNTQREMLLSNRVLSQTVEEGGLRQSPRYQGRADAADLLRVRTAVGTNRDSWTIAVGLRDEDAQRAQQALEVLLDVYLGYQQQQEKGRGEQALAFLATQVEEGGRKLEKARTEEQRFASENELISTDADNNFIARRLILLNEAMAVLIRDLTSSEALMAQVTTADSIADRGKRLEALMRLELIGHHTAVLEQQDALYTTQANEVLLSQKYLERHPRMVEAREQVESLRSALEQAVALARAGIESNQQKLVDQRDALAARIRKESDELVRYRENLIQLRKLSELADAQQRLYQQLVERLGQEKVTARLDEQTIAVIDPPHASAGAVNLNRPLSIAIALVMAGIAAAVAIIIHEFIDHRVRGSAEAGGITGLPLLAVIPEARGMGALGRGGDADAPAAVGEAVRALRTALRLVRRTTGGCRCLLVTSAESGDGKSSLVTRLAVSLGSSGERVLLVDADLRLPMLDGEIGERGQTGLSHLLAGDPGIAPISTSYANVDYLGAGVRPPNPSELLHSHCLPEWLAQCRTHYDYVLLDSPPVVEVADALVVGSHADGILLVVRDRHTTRAGLAECMARLAPLRERIHGIVFNGKRGPATNDTYTANEATDEPAARRA